ELVLAALDGVADALKHGLEAVAAGFAGAVQEEDARIILVGLVVVGDEDVVFGLAVGAFEGLAQEAGAGFFLLAAACGSRKKDAGEDDRNEQTTQNHGKSPKSEGKSKAQCTRESTTCPQ